MGLFKRKLEPVGAAAASPPIRRGDAPPFGLLSGHVPLQAGGGQG